MSDPSATHPESLIELTVDGRLVQVRDTGGSLLGALRDQLAVRGVKDGCSPQGQCGCCTVLVDGEARQDEIARMMGGEATSAARERAKELLALGAGVPD